MANYRISQVQIEKSPKLFCCFSRDSRSKMGLCNFCLSFDSFSQRSACSIYLNSIFVILFRCGSISITNLFPRSSVRSPHLACSMVPLCQSFPIVYRQSEKDVRPSERITCIKKSRRGYPQYRKN